MYSEKKRSPDAASAVWIIGMNLVGIAKARREKASKRAIRRKRTGAYFGPLAGGCMNSPFVDKGVIGWHQLGGSREGAWARRSRRCFYSIFALRSSPLVREPA